MFKEYFGTANRSTGVQEHVMSAVASVGKTVIIGALSFLWACPGNNPNTDGWFSQTGAPGSSEPSIPAGKLPAPKVLGQAPQYLGIELANYVPGSNTSLFLEHLGVNGVRVFISGVPVGSTLKQAFNVAWGKDAQGHSVDSAQAFTTAVAQVAQQASSFTLSSSNLFVTDQLHTQHLSLLAQLDLDPHTFDFSDYNPADSLYWQEHWALYAYIYQMARLLLAQGVTLYETQNEPDLVLPSVQDCLDRVLITSEAVRQAARDAAGSPRVTILGPTLGKNSVPLPADSWMLPVLAHLHDRFNGTPDAAQNSLDGWSYHRYSGSGAYFASLIDTLQAALKTASAPLALGITEYNAADAAQLDLSGESSDSVDVMAQFMSESVVLLPKVAYLNAYAFGMRANAKDGVPTSSGVAKNGLHWIDAANSSTFANVGGASRSGAAFSLLARNFSKGTELYDVAAENATKLDLVSTTDGNTIVVLSVNNQADNADFSVSWAAWGLQAGTPVRLDLVSANSYGQVAGVQPLGAGAQVEVSQPGYSAMLLTAPRRDTTHSETWPLSSDNVLQAGHDVPLTGQKLLRVAASTVAADDTSVAVLRFAPTGSTLLPWALLRLTVQSSDSRAAMLHVYGFFDSAFDATKLTWQNSSLMLPVTAATTVTQISDNLLNYQSSPQPRFLGTVVVPASSKDVTVRLNVSDFVNLGAQASTYVVVREFLNNGTLDHNPGPDSLADSSVTFYGSGAADPNTWPALELLRP